MKPQLWVIGGPNGSGKSTFTARHNLENRIPFVNPDEIALKLPDKNPTMAGKIAIQEQEKFLKNHESFAIETTLSGLRVVKLLQRAKKEGFKVNLVYIGLESPEINILRVYRRVYKGGHDVPDEDIIRRYVRSMNNLKLAIESSDRIFVLDNSDEKGFRLLFSREHGRIKYVSPEMPKWASSYLKEYIQQYAINHYCNL